MSEDNLRPDTSKRVEKIEKRIKELDIENNIMLLRANINNGLTKIKKEFAYPKENTAIILGKKEIDLLYKAYELLEIESEFKVGFNSKGFIDYIWDAKVYVADVPSVVDVVISAESFVRNAESN